MSFSYTLMNCHAHAAAGKTTLALMIAENLPTWPPPKTATFNSFIHVGWDRDALAALRMLGHKAKYALDMQKLMSPLRPGEPKRPYLANPMAAMEYVVNYVRDVAAKDGKVNFLIGDTETSRNELFWGWLQRTRKPSTARDNQRLYGELLQLERQYYGALATAGIPVMMCLWHTSILTKEDGEPAGAKAKRVQYQMGNESVEVGPAMIGGGVRIYTGQPSLEVSLEKKTIGKAESRWVMFEGAGRTKNRFQEFLKAKMKPEEFVKAYRKCITE